MTNSNSFLLIIFREGSECEMQYALGGRDFVSLLFYEQKFSFYSNRIIGYSLVLVHGWQEAGAPRRGG